MEASDLRLSEQSGASNTEIRARACPNCYLCGSKGEPLYEDLTDRLFGAPGKWSLSRCPNRGCGLAWLNPMPLESDIARAYANYFTHEDFTPPRRPVNLGLVRRTWRWMKTAYLAEEFGCGEIAPGMRRKLACLAVKMLPPFREQLEAPYRYLPRQKKGRVLDVGCGNGEMLQVAQRMGWDAEGVEVDPQAVAAAKKRGLRVHQCSLAEQNFADDSFDLILMNHVIEHVHDPLGLLRECYRVLRPGCLLVVWTPNLDSWGHRQFGPSWRGLEPPRHLYLFNRKNLVDLAQRAGFIEPRVTSTVRPTVGIFLESPRIRSSGRGDPNRAPNFAELTRAYSAAFAEAALRLFDPFAGDELLLEARK